jgi:CBS domain containing-hemolysin-like protein
MISLSALAAVVFFCLVLEAFFSGSEIAVVASNKALLRQRAPAGSRRLRLVEEFQARPQRLLGTTLIGTNLAMVVAVSTATVFFRSRYGALGELYTLLSISPLALLCAEMVPKVYFQQYADRIAPRVLVPLWLVSRLLSPLLAVATGFAGILTRALGGESRKIPFVTREEIQLLLTGAARPAGREAHERRMIGRVFRFAETTVEEVMIPLINVQALDEKSTVADALGQVRKDMHSRYPVFHERVDNVIGVIHSVDLIQAADPKSGIKDLVRPAVYLTETMPVHDALARMQKENFLLAAVVDEYGGCVGIITREDILEEIVGEIEDEHDRRLRLYRKLDERRFLIQARMEIDQINEALNLDLPEGEYETLAGFLLAQIGHIPKTGEQHRFRDLTFVIREATPRAIQEVMVVREQITSANPQR